MSCLNVNEVRLAGRLTETPEIKQTTTGGVAVTSFRVAVKRRTAKKGEEPVTDFFTVVAWRQLAEFIGKYFDKGSAIYITGELRQRIYRDKNNDSRTIVEVEATDAKFIDSKSDIGKQSKEDNAAENADEYEVLSADGVPF